MGKEAEGAVWDAEILRCGKATLETRKNVNIVHLRGTHAQMGHQHGKLAEARCGDVVLTYFDDVIETLIKHSVPSIAGPVSKFLKWLFYKLNYKRVSPGVQEHLAALNDALGYEPGKAQKVVLVPDVIHFLIGKSFPALVAAPGCSGFMARGSATDDGRLIVGRNFDFFGQGVWDVNNTLLFLEPEDSQKYCWIGALGVPGSGQGMNESGIIISMHTKFNRDVRFTGVPLFSLIADILGKCETVDEAVRAIEAQPRVCGLSLFIVDSKTREAVVAGFSANHLEVIRPENDVLVRTNHYVTDEMKKYEVAPHPWVLHSNSRFNRLHEMLEEKRGSLVAADVPSMLSDCTDYWEQRRSIVGHIVGATNNSQSIVFSPDEDSIWLGNGSYPVCMSDCFAGFRISALFAGDGDNYEIDDLAGGATLDEKEKEAQEHYQKAWVAQMDNFRDDLAVSHLRRAAHALPSEPIFPRMAGVILLKNHKYQQALPLLVKNAEYEYKSDITRAESFVWVGRCLDLLGRHAEAVTYYRRAAEIDAPPVSSAAAAHVNRPFRAKQLFDVSPDFVIGTAMAKY